MSTIKGHEIGTHVVAAAKRTHHARNAAHTHAHTRSIKRDAERKAHAARMAANDQVSGGQR